MTIASVFTDYKRRRLFFAPKTAFEVTGNMKGPEYVSLFGGMAASKSQGHRVASTIPKRRRVLIATDAASEGPTAGDRPPASAHYDVPWNPSRLEQRNAASIAMPARDVTIILSQRRRCRPQVLSRVVRSRADSRTLGAW